MPQRVILTKGIQSSGKSTWSESFITKHPDFKRVNKDTFRHMLSNYSYTPSNEQVVQQLWESSVAAVLNSGYNLIIDEMHLNPDIFEKNINFIKSISPNALIKVKEFKITLGEAIQRDLRRPFSVGEKVIRNTYKKYIIPKPENDCYSYDLIDQLKAFVIDIDGTLALKYPDRDIYDGSLVHKDSVIFPVWEIIQLAQYYNSKEKKGNFDDPYQIILCSGRDEKYREVTTNWCHDKHIYFHHLFMREANDDRPDAVIKKEIYHNKIKGKFNVIGVFDDRPQVLRMWQNELGLFTFAVNQDVDCLNDF